MTIQPRLMLAAALTFGVSAAAAAPAAPLECRGADTMQGVVESLARAFVAHDRGVRIHVGRRETLSAQAFIDLLAGRANCALFAREFFGAERAAYTARFGGTPAVVPIALGSFATLHATHAITIYVNAANPVSQLSLSQLEQLFEASLPDLPPAVTRWGQLGATGRFAAEPVHIYGMRPDRESGNPPGIVNFLRQRLLGGRPMRADVHVIEDRPGAPALAGIVQAVAADPAGIGYSGFGFAQTGVKALRLCTQARGCIAGTQSNVASGAYPLHRKIYLVFPRGAEGRISAPAQAFAQFVLSPRGQRIIAAGNEHFLPLPLAERKQSQRIAQAREESMPPPFGIAALPVYQPQPVSPLTQAGYVRRDGKVSIAGYNDMRPLLAALDLLFTASHPNIDFALDLEGTRTAPPALTGGRSLLAPMGADFEAAALSDFRARWGNDPLRIPIAHDCLDPWARSSPLAVYAGRGNPLTTLTKAQLARAFSGDADRWGELGVDGPLHDAPIHRYGLGVETPLARLFAGRILDGRAPAPWTASNHSRGVIAMMADDPLALGFADLNQADPRLKVLALAACEQCGASKGGAADLVAGRYLLDRHLFIFLRQEKGFHIDPLAREYLRLVLSREGQAAIAASAPHYLPLNAEEVSAELKRLN